MFKVDRMGHVLWIYWADIAEWKNALIIGKSSFYISKTLSLFFENLESIEIDTLNGKLDVFRNDKKHKKQYDLIFFAQPPLVNLHGKFTAKGLLNALHNILSKRGCLVMGYSKDLKLIKLIIKKVLRTSEVKKGIEDYKIYNSKFDPKSFITTIKKDKRFKVDSNLYVFPHPANALTLSDSDIFFKKINDWKRRNTRNLIVLWIIGSKVTYRFSKHWWPYHILIIKKNTEYE